MDLTSKAMLARVSIKGIWSAVGEDEEASKYLARQKGIRPEIYRAMKKICDPKLVPTLKAFNSARNTLYTLHRRLTLAWDDKSGRLLPGDQYFDYMQQIGDAKQKVIETYEAFLADIPGLQAKFQSDPETAGAYRAEDWPDVTELRLKVDIRVRITPLADADDFRVRLGAEEEAKIKEQCQRDLYANLAGGLSELVGDLKQVVLDSQASIEKYEMDNKGKVLHTFKDSAVTNVRNMVARARKLNVIGLPDLNTVCDEVEALICKHEPQVLRDNFILRQQTVGHAVTIAKKLGVIEDVLCRQAEAA